MENYQPQRKGFSFLSFLLGFIIGIIFLVGAIGGVIIFALTSKLDKVFEIVGVDNGKDENGNNKIINTDVESGGVETVLQLITKVTQIAGDTQNLSVGEVENLIPAVGGLVDGFHGMLSGYLAIEREELTSVKFSEFGDFVTEKLLDVQPAALIDSFGMGELLDNKIMSLVLLGTEAKYVEVGSEKYPVYYDVYNFDDGVYLREGDGAALSSAYRDALCEKNGGYRLYYYISGETAYVTDENCTYAAPVSRSALGQKYSPYTPEYATLSGNFYYDGDEKVVVNPVTLRTLSDGGLSSLDEIYLTEFIAGDNDLASKILGGISIGDIMNGQVDFADMLDNMPLADLMQVKISDGIMLNLIWKIKSVEEAVGADYTHVGVYTVDGEQFDCYITAEISDSGEIISGAYYYDANAERIEIQSLTVGDLMNGFDLNGMIEDITVAEFVDIKASDSIMSYLGYGLYGFNADRTQAYVEIDGEEVLCYIIVNESGVITRVVTENGNTVKSAGLNDISDNINGITEKLTIGDLLGETDDKILSKLADCKIGEISSGIDNLLLGDLIEPGDNKLLNALKDTKVSELSSAISGLTLDQIMDISSDDKVLSQIKSATIETLPSAINGITVNAMFADEIYSVKDDNGNVVTRAECKLATVYNAEYLYYEKNENGDFTLVNISGNELGKLTAAQFNAGTYYTYGAAQGEWKILLYANDGGTKTEKAYTINKMSEMISNVAANMQSSTLKELDDAGILVFENKENLNNKVYYLDNGIPKQSEKTIGEMQLMELINFIVNNLSNQSA